MTTSLFFDSEVPVAGPCDPFEPDFEPAPAQPPSKVRIWPPCHRSLSPVENVGLCLKPVEQGDRLYKDALDTRRRRGLLIVNPLLWNVYLILV